MCVYSMIADHFIDKWKPLAPQHNDPPAPLPVLQPPLYLQPLLTPAEVQELRTLLERARKYDAEHDQPGCELEDKKRLLRELAGKLGVKIDFL
jgi:hypothetical protein